MDLFDLLPNLYPAAYRGIEFHMPDSRHEVGRRMVRFLFPGSDVAVDEDLGAIDGPIRITGLVMGDDYIRQARALERAFREPGPGTLSHPWLGEIQVVLREPAAIGFDNARLRTATIEATFLPASERQVGPADTLAELLDGLDALRSAARRMLRQVLAPAAMPLAVLSYAQNFAFSAASAWRGALAGAAAASATIAGSADALRALEGIGALGAPSIGARMGDGLAAVPAAVAAQAVILPAPAIGPAREEDGTPASPEAAVRLLLAAIEALAAGLSDPAPGPSLAAAARLLALAEAIRCAADIRHASRQDALVWRARIDAALAEQARDAEGLVLTVPREGALLWREIARLRAAWARDMSVRIGRLPAVALLRLPQPAGAWLIAQHIAGDAPATVAAEYAELVARNRVRHPGLVTAATLEILRPEPGGWRQLAVGAQEDDAAAGGGQRLDIDFVLDMSALG